MKNKILFITNLHGEVNAEHIKVVPLDDKAANYIHIFFTKVITTLGNNVFKEKPIIAIDTENDGLDPYTAKPLLLIIGNSTQTIVIDTREKEKLNSIIEVINRFTKTIIFLGANIKYDYKILKIQLGITLETCYDVMVADNRLTQNMGYRYNLPAIVERYLRKPPPNWMDKSIRDDFIGIAGNVLNFTFKNKHINYAAADTMELLEINSIQHDKLEKWGILNFMLEVEYPLILTLSKMELKGFKFDAPSWTKVLHSNKLKRFSIEQELDEIFWDLREELACLANMILIVGGRYDRLRTPPTLEPEKDIFGDIIPIDESRAKTKYPFINYNSSLEITRIFGALEQELCADDGEIYDIMMKYEVNTKSVVKIIKREDVTFTTKESELQQYMISRPDSIMIPFIKKLIEFRGFNTRINTFGQSFINYVNPITDRIHTVYRQCSEDKSAEANSVQGVSPVNGRLSSGNTRQGYYNAQNVPALKMYRNCFIADEGYSIITCDLSGAEVTVMASKANDAKLLKLVASDIHSYMATKAWRNIYLERGEYDKAKSFIVSKTENADKRKSGKNLTFGTVYGAHSKRAARTLNVSKREGQIYIDTIKSIIPITTSYVESNVALALKKGYLVIDEISNTRVWFPEVVRILRTNRELSKWNKIASPREQRELLPIPFEVMRDVDGQARNIPISGTQANMVKDAMVTLDSFIKENNLDITILNSVHDELVVQMHNKYLKDVINYKGNMVNGGELVKRIMCDRANVYLTNGFKMDADYTIKPYWTK